jgi:hypothetical protein
MPLSQIAPRLKKLLLMLSSDRDGEVVAAARLIGTTLRSAGADWHDLVAGLLAPTSKRPPPPPHDDANSEWRVMRGFCLNRDRLLRSREHEFIISLGDWCGDLTERQHAWLVAIYRRLGGT